MAPAQNGQAEPPSRTASRQSSSGPERSNSSIWSLFGSKGRSKSKAKLGEKSTMYYHPELKRWVEKGKEHEAEQEAAAAEPPKVAPVLATTSTPGGRKPLSARYVSNFPTSGSTTSLPEASANSKPSLSVSASGTSLVPVLRAPASVGALGTPKFFVPQAPASTNSSSTNLFSQHSRTASAPATQQQDVSPGNSDPGSMQDSMQAEGNGKAAAYVEDGSQNGVLSSMLVLSGESNNGSHAFAHAGPQHSDSRQEQVTDQTPQPSSPPHGGLTLTPPVTSSSPRFHHHHHHHHGQHRPGMPPPAPKSVPGTRSHHHADHQQHQQHDHASAGLEAADRQVSKSSSNLAEHLAALKAAVQSGKSGTAVKIPAAPRSTPHPGRQDSSPLDADLDQIMHPGVRHKLDGPLPWELPDELKYSNEFISVCANWQRDNPDTEYSPELLRSKLGMGTAGNSPEQVQPADQGSTAAAAVAEVSGVESSQELSFTMQRSGRAASEQPQHSAASYYSSSVVLAYDEPAAEPQTVATASASVYGDAGSLHVAQAAEFGTADASGSQYDASYQAWPGYSSATPSQQLSTQHASSNAVLPVEPNNTKSVPEAAAVRSGHTGEAAAAADAWVAGQRQWGSADGSAAGHAPMSPRTPDQGNSEPADRHTMPSASHASSALHGEQPQQNSSWADEHTAPHPQWPADAEGGQVLDAEGGAVATEQVTTQDNTTDVYEGAAGTQGGHAAVEANASAVMELTDEEHVQYAAWLESWAVTITRLSEDPEYNLTQEYATWHQQYLYWDQRIPGLQMHMQQYQAAQQAAGAGESYQQTQYYMSNAVEGGVMYATQQQQQQDTGADEYAAAAVANAATAGAVDESHAQDVSLAGGVPEQQLLSQGTQHTANDAHEPQIDGPPYQYEHELLQQDDMVTGQQMPGSIEGNAANTVHMETDLHQAQPETLIDAEVQESVHGHEVQASAQQQDHLSHQVDAISEQLVSETLDQVLAEEAAAAAALLQFRKEPSAVPEVVSETALHMSVHPGRPGEPPVRTVELSEAVEEDNNGMQLAVAASTAWHEHQQLGASQHADANGDLAAVAATAHMQDATQVDSTVAANAEWYMGWLVSQVSAGQQLPSSLTHSMQQLLQLLHDPSLCAALGVAPVSMQVPDSNRQGAQVAHEQQGGEVGKQGTAQPHAAAVVAANGWYHVADADELQLNSCASAAEDILQDGSCVDEHAQQQQQRSVQHAAVDTPIELLEHAIAQRTAELQATFDAQLAERTAAVQAAAEAASQQQLAAAEATWTERLSAVVAEHSARIEAMHAEFTQGMEAEIQSRVDAAQHATAMQYEAQLSQSAAKVHELQQELAMLQAQCEEQQSDMTDLTVCVGMETEKVEALKEALLAAGIDAEAIIAPIEEQHALRGMEADEADEEGQAEIDMAEGEGSSTSQVVEVQEGEGMVASPAAPLHMDTSDELLQTEMVSEATHFEVAQSSQAEHAEQHQDDESNAAAMQAEPLEQQDADMDAPDAGLADSAVQVEAVEEAPLTEAAAAVSIAFDIEGAAAAWDGAVMEPLADDAMPTTQPCHEEQSASALDTSEAAHGTAIAAVLEEPEEASDLQGCVVSDALPVKQQPWAEPTASGRFGVAMEEAPDLTQLDGWEGQGDGWGGEGWEGVVDGEASNSTSLLV